MLGQQAGVQRARRTKLKFEILDDASALEDIVALARMAHKERQFYRMPVALV